MTVLITALMILLGVPMQVDDGSYVLSVPAGAEPAGGWPLVLAYHGAGGTGTQLQQATQFAPDGMVVAFMNGIGGRWDAGPGLTANQDPCCGDTGRDEAAYTQQVIDQVMTDHRIDPARIYAMGFSNGGMEAFTLACTSNGWDHSIRSAVVVSGTLVTPCRTTPVRVLRIHDPDDGTVPLCERTADPRGCQGFEGRWFPSKFQVEARRPGSEITYRVGPYGVGTHRWPPFANQAIVDYFEGAGK